MNHKHTMGGSSKDPVPHCLDCGWTPPTTESWAEKMGNLDNISDDYRGDPPDWQRRFQKEYRRAYEGILPEEELVKGNPWFEDFIRTERESYQKELVERIQKNREMIPATNYEKNAQPFGGPEDYEKRGRHNALTEVLEIIRSLN